MFVQSDSTLHEVHSIVQEKLNLINDYESYKDSNKINKVNKKLEQYHLVEIICAMLFDNNQNEEGVFSEKFSQSINDLADKNSTYLSIENYMIDSYDYKKDAFVDFSFHEKFDFEPSPNDYPLQIVDVVGQENVEEAQQQLIMLCKMWTNGSPKHISVCYTNYFDCFVRMFGELNLKHHPVLTQLHDACIQHILKRISKCDKKKCREKHSIFIEFEPYEEFMGDDYKHHEEDDEYYSEDEDMREIYDEVEQWKGRYPFCGLLSGEDSVEDMFWRLDHL